MVEIMKADNGYIVLDDVDGVRIKSDFDGVINWLREQFNEPAPFISVVDGATNGCYIINNATSDEHAIGIPLGLAVARNIDGTAIIEDQQYPVTLDVRPIEGTVGTTRLYEDERTVDSCECAIKTERK